MRIINLTFNNKKIDRSAYVRALMTLNGLRPWDVCLALNVTSAAVAHCIRGRKGSMRIKKYIADQLSMDFKALWGHEYSPRKSRKEAA